MTFLPILSLLLVLPDLVTVWLDSTMTFLPMLSLLPLLLEVVSVTVSVVLVAPLVAFLKLVVVVVSTTSSVIYSSKFSGIGCPAMPISSTLSISVYLIFLSYKSLLKHL